jgi:hypothetical protein
MNKHQIIEHTITVINKLPEEKIKAISDFADFIYSKYEEEILSEGIQKLANDPVTYDFLNKEDEDLYTLSDLKETYRAKG